MRKKGKTCRCSSKSTMTWQVMNAWTNWHNNGGSSNAFLNGNYLSVGGFPDFNLSMLAPNTLTYRIVSDLGLHREEKNGLWFTPHPQHRQHRLQIERNEFVG